MKNTTLGFWMGAVSMTALVLFISGVESFLRWSLTAPDAKDLRVDIVLIATGAAIGTLAGLFNPAPEELKR